MSDSHARARLPPLFSLQVFEAAARHGNFSRAGQELHLTQSAISRQIQQLETWCDRQLFLRHGPRVQLTQDGHELLAKLGAPLAALHAAVYQDPQQAKLPLQINLLASTARAWLLPRIADFQQRHPDIDLHIQTDYALINPAPQLPIVAIRYGHLPPKNIYAQLLFDDPLYVVASPKLIRKYGRDPIRWPAPLLLRNTGRDWSIWLESYAPERLHDAAGSQFNDVSIMLDAAEAGLGFALTRDSVAAPRLQSKTLAQASDGVIRDAPMKNYLVCRKDCTALPAVAAFITWVSEQARIWVVQRAQW
jgi:LysR family transcriptional regulator, glycine cleavage system transcriptional activator